MCLFVFKFICSKLLTRKVGIKLISSLQQTNIVYCHFHRKQTYLSWYSLTIIFFITKETNIPKLALIDNCFPDLIETSTFISYDVQQMLSIGKLKSIRLNWYCIYCVTFIIIIISSLSFSRHKKIKPTTVCTCNIQGWNIFISQLTSYSCEKLLVIFRAPCVPLLDRFTT